MLSCRCCSSCPGSCRLGRGNSFPGKAPSPAHSPEGTRPSPLARPGLLGPALALQKQLPAGSTKSFSHFQVLQGQGCSGLVQTKLWAGAAGRAPAPGPRCSGAHSGAEPSGVRGGAGQGLPGPRRLLVCKND